MTKPNDLIPPHPFTTAWAHDHGLSKRMLSTLVSDGALRRVMRGVYVSSQLEDTQELRAACAALVLPPHAVTVDRSAAWLLGIDLFGLAELEIMPDLEVVSIDGSDRVTRTGCLGGKRDLAPQDIMTIGGVRVTTPLRTACDIACLRGGRRALAALDAFRRTYGLTENDFVRMLPRYAGRRGVCQLRHLIPLSTDKAESQPESWVRHEIDDEGLPLPEPNVWIDVPGWGMARGDLVYEKEMIIVEYDGEEHHTSDADKAHDEARREALRRAGWTVIVVRKDGFSGPGREKWVTELKEALREHPVDTTLVPLRPKRVYARGPADSSYVPRGRRT